MMTLSERYRDALVADPRQDALNQLQADRFGSKIAADEQAGLVDQALALGSALAEQVLQETGEAQVANLLAENSEELVPNLLAIADFYGAQVTEDEYPVAPEFTTIGYFETPNQLFVNRWFAQYDEEVQTAEMPLLAYEQWRPVALAHELFHYLDEMKKMVPPQDYRLSLWKLGPYTHKTELTILREIAAMSFAQHLTNWPFYPGRLTDMLMQLTELDLNERS